MGAVICSKPVIDDDENGNIFIVVPVENRFRVQNTHTTTTTYQQLLNNLKTTHYNLISEFSTGFGDH